MGAQDHIREQALRETWRNSPFRVRCRVLKYDALGEPSPTCVVLPYTAMESRDSFSNEEEWLAENSYELPVNFPGGIIFDIDPGLYDVFVDAPLKYSRDCYPVPTTEHRSKAAHVPKGYTYDEVIDRAVDPNSIQMRIIRSRQRINSFQACEFSQNPMVAKANEVWYGNIRQALDQGMVDIWSEPHKYIARFHHQAINFLTEQVKMPLCDGVQISWRDTVEHPFQRHFGSSTVINYPRFLRTLGVDPGFIIGVIANLRKYFHSLDFDDTKQRIEKYKTYEVISFRDDIPEA